MRGILAKVSLREEVRLLAPLHSLSKVDDLHPHERRNFSDLGGSGGHGAAQLRHGKSVNLRGIVLVGPQVNTSEGVAGV
jgi:hypothetical protein